MKNNILVLSSIALSIVSLCLVFFLSQNSKIVYVDMQKVFAEFKGTKEYKIKLEGLVSKQRGVLDTMRLEVVALEQNNAPDAPILVAKKKHYMYLYEEFSKNQQEQTQDFDTKIWTQIDAYAKTFGEEKGYDFVLGNKKDGVVFYSNTSKEVTEDFLKYINSKYAGE